MTRRVIWSDDARADLLEQVGRIAADNPDAADRVFMRVLATGESLGEFAIGHPGRVPGTHEKTVARLPYIIAYALTDGDKAVSILRVIHTARNWGQGEWPE